MGPMLVAVVAALACQAPPQPTPIDQALASVLLLVTRKADGSGGFGAAVLVDDKGLALTNLHVVGDATRTLALGYDPTKPSYAAHDGGLARVAFEREDDLVDVRLVRGDPALDLALVKLARVPKGAQPARIAPAAPQLGAPVIAIGHPEQNVWTLTRGQVSALRTGSIQHDAPLNPGNSGGPLVDETGAVIGINTIVQKDTEGISYALPIALTDKLIRLGQPPAALARGSPETAALSCARARELDLPILEQCVDWDDAYDRWRALVDELLREHGNQLYRRHTDTLAVWLAGEGAREPWLRRFKKMALGFAVGDAAGDMRETMQGFTMYLLDISRGGKPGPPPSDAQLKRVLAAELKLSKQHDFEENPLAKYDADLLRDYGLKTRVGDRTALRKLLKMGVRVRGVAKVGHDLAWVHLDGKNLDGSLYRYSSLWARRGDHWVERMMPSKAELATLPPEFPRVLFLWDFTLLVAGLWTEWYLPLVLVCDDPSGLRYDEAVIKGQEQYLERALALKGGSLSSWLKGPPLKQ